MSEILTIANLRHAASRVWTCAEPEFRLSWMKLCSSDNHHTTAPLMIFNLSGFLMVLVGPLSEIFTITDLRHAASRVWTCPEPEFRLSWMKLCCSNNHYTTAPLMIFNLSGFPTMLGLMGFNSKLLAQWSVRLWLHGSGNCSFMVQFLLRSLEFVILDKSQAWYHPISKSAQK